MDLFITITQFFTSNYVNWWTGIVWITCVFGLSFWRHPLTAEDLLLSKLYNAKFLQICSDEQTNPFTSWMPWAIDVQTKFHFWVNYSFIIEVADVIRESRVHVMLSWDFWISEETMAITCSRLNSSHQGHVNHREVIELHESLISSCPPLSLVLLYTRTLWSVSFWNHSFIIISFLEWLWFHFKYQCLLSALSVSVLCCYTGFTQFVNFTNYYK